MIEADRAYTAPPLCTSIIQGLAEFVAIALFIGSVLIWAAIAMGA